MSDLALTIFSGLALVLLALAFPLQWRARNTSTLLNLAWLFISGFVTFLNSILWWKRYDVFAHVWCDISVKILSVFPVGLAASSLCINRRLAAIASSRSVIQDRKSKTRGIAIDLALGIGLPVFQMVVSYVFQPHRFDIMEGVGPEPLIWPCVGSILLYYSCPVLLYLISAVYGAYAIRYFVLRRAQVKLLLRSSRGGLELSHYFRLIGMATSDIIFGLPMAVWYLQVAIHNIRPWRSWKAVHSHFSRVVARSDAQILPYASRTIQHLLPLWLFPFMGFLFFLFFGVGEDAVKEYARWLRSLTKLFSKRKTKSNVPLAPMLGSTVVHPSGSVWAAPVREEEVFGATVRAEDVDPIKSHGHQAFEVAVTVQREVV